MDRENDAADLHDTAEAATTLPNSFHRRQAQALHLFLSPGRTLPDEAAVGRSPDLSSAEESNDDGADAAAAAATLSMSRKSDIGPSRPVTPLRLPQPTVRLGAAWGNAAMTAESAAKNGSCGTPLANTATASPLLERDPRRPSANGGADVQNDGDCGVLVTPTSQTLPAPAAFDGGVPNVPALAHWHATTSAETRSNSARTSRANEVATPRTEPIETPRESGAAPRSSTVKDTTPTPAVQGTPALVVWRAEMGEVGSDVDTTRRTPFVLTSNRREATDTSQSAASQATDARAAMSQPARRRRECKRRRRGRQQRTSELFPSRQIEGNTDGDPSGEDEDTPDATTSSSSESDSEDVFDDNGGGTGCVFNMCAGCVACFYYLAVRCCTCRCTWLRRACYYCCCCCCNGCRRCSCWIGSSASQENDLSPVNASADDADDASTEPQLRRPLLSPAAEDHPVDGSGLFLHNVTSRNARGGEPPSSTQRIISPASSATSPPLWRTLTPRAAQALQFSESENSDNDGSVADYANRDAAQRRRERQRDAPRTPHPAAVDEDVGHPCTTSLRRRFVKRLARYSPYRLLAYLNVFAGSEDDTESTRGGGAQATVTQPTAEHPPARSPLANADAAPLTQPGNALRGEDVGRGAHLSNGDRPIGLIRAGTTGSLPATASAVSTDMRCGQTSWRRVSGDGQVFVLLHYLSFALLMLAVVVLTVFEFSHDLVATVTDETACNCFPYEDRFRPDFSFSLVCFFLNGIFASYYAVRAVRYEKGGLLVVQVFIMLLQLCRTVYFLFFVADRYLRRFEDTAAPPGVELQHRTWHQGNEDGMEQGSSAPTSSSESSRVIPLLLFTWVSLIASITLCFFASLLLPWVYARFGWRRYAQGIVSVRLARVRQRLTTLQTCVQLDRVITLNAYLATVFLLDSWIDQYELFLVVGAVLFVYAVLVPSLRRTHHWWPLLCAGGVLLASTGYFAAVIGDSLYNDHRLRAKSSSPWYSTCYTDQLPQCLVHISPWYDVSIYRDSVCHPTKGPGTVLATPRTSLARSLAKPILPSAPVPVAYVDNATDTYLPTFGAKHDYFQVHACNETCFLHEEAANAQLLTRGIASCCGYYGQCRLKDAYRTYAVILLTLLTALSYGVRVVLLAVAWRRIIGHDDVSIAFFLESKRQRRSGRRHRRHQRPRQEESDLHAAPNAEGGYRQAPSASSPCEVLLWNVSQYDAWRAESADVGVGSQTDLAARRVAWPETPSSTRENPLSL